MSPEPEDDPGAEDDEIQAIEEFCSALERSDPAPDLLDALGKAAFDHRGPSTPRATVVADVVVADSGGDSYRRVTLSRGADEVMVVRIRKASGAAKVSLEGNVADAVPTVVTPDGRPTVLDATDRGWTAEIAPAAIRLVAETWHSEWIRL